MSLRAISNIPTPGTTTNNNAPTGAVGEFVTATVVSGSSIVLTTATGANVTSISLTAGDWDVDGQVDFTPAATTNVTQYNASCSATSATLATQPGGAGFGTDGTFIVNQAAQVPVSTFCAATMTIRVSIAATTTVFLVAQAVFTVAALNAYGTIRARRVR